MKPEGVLQTDMDDIEMDPHELFMQLGMLVVESRLPDLSTKGRRQGPHCPLVMGEPNWHTCDLHTYYCRRARGMQKEMQTLWRNRVPMCIEVMLLPNCYHGVERVEGSDASLPTDKGGNILLEQWNIQVLPKRLADNPVSVKALFQAMQSHLYFSQLSAWLNRTHGKAPANISYRISPPGDFCTSSFSQIPECHTFPVAGVSKSLSMCVTARCLPRMHDIPHIRCREPHGKEATLQGAMGGHSRETSPHDSPTGVSSQSPDRHIGLNPARFQKPRVITEQPREIVPREVGRGFRGPDTHRRAAAAHTDQHKAKSPQGLLSHMHQDPGLPSPAKHTGAIPKRPPCKSPPPPPAFYESDCASSAPELDSLSPEHDDAIPQATTSDATSPKVILTQKAPHPAYYGKEKVNWVLRNIVSNNSSTDSDSSSPDIDRFLNKNLANRLEPLSPAEMENYLKKLCNTTSSHGKKEYDSQCNNKKPQCVYNLHSSDRPQSPVFDRTAENQSKCTEECTRDLAEISASFSTLLRRGGYDEPEKDTKSKPKTHKNVSHKPNKSLKSSKRQEKGRSLQEPAAEYKLTQPRSLSIHEAGEDEVTFSLADEDDTEEGSKEYSNHSHSNGSTANGDSYQAPRPTQSDSDHQGYYMNGNSDLGKENSHATNGVSPQCPSSQGQMPTKPFHKSISCPGSSHNKGFVLPSHTIAVKANTLLKTVMRKELTQTDQCETESQPKTIPTDFERATFQKSLNSSANMIFHASTGLPLQSSPAPTKKRPGGFEYDSSLTNPRAIKNSLSCVNLDSQEALDNGKVETEQHQRLYSASAPASTNCLLGNFEESMLNGRLEPSGVVEGFTADIGASGSFCPKHVTLPLTAFFFSLSDDNAPSPYLGHINLDSLGKRGFHVPKKGTIQVTMFNPNKTVMKMFVVVYDLSDMSANCQTFLRQRTLYMPISGSQCDTPGAPVYLRYLIHLRFSSSKSNKIYLHTDIRLIFARDKFEFDSRVANYEMRSFTEGPVNPKFSPKR